MYHSRLEPTIDDLQAQIDRLNRTIREWRDQQERQAPREDRLSQLSDRGSEILSRWEATDQRYSQAVDEIEARLADWGAMESRLHRDALERVRTFERTMQSEWQTLRQMHEEPLRQLQEQAAALGETCVAAANLSLRGYERAEARLAALETDLRTQLTQLSQQVHAALAEVRRASLPPGPPAEPFQLDSVMRLHGDLRSGASAFPSEEALQPARPVDGPRAVEPRTSGIVPEIIDIPRPAEAARVAAMPAAVEPARPVDAPLRPVDVAARLVDTDARPVEPRTPDVVSEPVVLRPRPVLAQTSGAATAPAVAPDIKLAGVAGPSAVADRLSGTRLPDSAFPLKEDASGGADTTRRSESRERSRRVQRPNRTARLAAAGVGLAVIVAGVIAFGRMPGPETNAFAPSPNMSEAATVASSPVADAAVQPAAAVADAPPPVAPAAALAAPVLNQPDGPEVAAGRSAEILASPDVVRLLLRGVEGAQDAGAQLMWSRTLGMVLSATKLPPLEPGTTYRLALLGASGQVPVTAFAPDANGRARLVVTNPADLPRPVHGAVITLEHGDGTSGVPGVIVLERGAR